ncbi:MAG: IS701 family transposase [Actinobacteria bacterium]|nr:IS701 family transposase [Actinomycetota bacterium]
MTKRLPVTPAPGPLEDYALSFDDLFGARAQREGFRRYLEGLLLPTERNKTLTALANTEPIVGAQRKEAQSLQWFLSESGWDPELLNARRLLLLRADPQSAPDEEGVLVIDEHGDRKWGKQTAHVGRQYLANIGKVDSGVVSVSSLWADEGVYYPLEVEPYTPKHHFEKGKADPKFRTKPRIAARLVERSLKMGVPFRAVVADSFYGEDEGFKERLSELKVGYVLALKPTHSWWHKEGEQIGALWEAAQGAGWKDENEPGEWLEVVRTFRDGHEESWWALEVEAGPYGPRRALRALVVSTDPGELPDLSSWYLVTNLPHPGSERAREEGALPAADLLEVVRLYGLRMWVEQSYKQVKHALGWSQYQVRSDLAIRRHWQLVCCAFSFCWWASSFLGVEAASPAGVEVPKQDPKQDEANTITTTTTTTTEKVERGEKGGRGGGEKEATAKFVAASIEEGEGVVGAVGNGVALLEGVLGSSPAKGVRRAA